MVSIGRLTEKELGFLQRKPITSPKAEHSISLLTEAGIQSSTNVTDQISYEKSQEDDWNTQRTQINCELPTQLKLRIRH